MEWIEWNEISQFEQRATPQLLEQEAKHSLMLGVLEAAKQGRYSNVYQVTVEEDGKLLAVLQMTYPHPLNVVIIAKEQAEAIMHFIASRLHEQNVSFQAFISEREYALLFRSHWYAFTGTEPSIAMAQGVYQLTTVEDLPKADGAMRQARNEDQSLLESWYAAFEKETGLTESSPERIRSSVETMITLGEAYIWEVAGEAVTCAKTARPTASGITVSFVYTPPQARRQGYARSLVSDLSTEMLQVKQFCTLYTDLLNPTSNKIYQEIGYRPLYESMWLQIEK